MTKLNLQLGQSVEDEYPTNYVFGMVGHLGHDNKLFDRTCPACRGMYSSYGQSTCKKCSQPLTYITSKENKAMAISEGTIYPSFGPKQKKRDADTIANRKNGVKVIYRFKIYSFADESGVLSPPQNHHLMKSGAQVELAIANHEVITSWFMSKEDGQPRMEIMLMVYPKYGDYAKIISEPKASQNVTHVPVDTQGKPAPVNTDAIDKELAEVKKRLDILLKASGHPVMEEEPVIVLTPEGVREQVVSEELEPPWKNGSQETEAVESVGAEDVGDVFEKAT